MLVDIIQEYHKATKRDYLARMNKEKPRNMDISRTFGYDYWDGKRKFGYGGHKYDGRWKPVAQKLIDRYQLTEKSKILDIGCGKGFLGYELEQLLGTEVCGCDISKYALDECKLTNYFHFDVGTETELGFKHKLDLIISINVLHNLILPDFVNALEVINKNAKHSYIVMDSYRNSEELFNLQCWSLTCEMFMQPEEWEFLFRHFGYKGDFEFIFYS